MEYSRFLDCLAADFARLRAVVPTDLTAGRLCFAQGLQPGEGMAGSVIGRAHTNSAPDIYFYDKGRTTPKYVINFHPNDVLWDGTPAGQPR